MKRITSLQALRAIAFINIFISHCGVTMFFGGAWGVSLFFVLSGFVMYYAYCERDLGANLLSRIKFAYVKINYIIFVTYSNYVWGVNISHIC